MCCFGAKNSCPVLFQDAHQLLDAVAKLEIVSVFCSKAKTATACCYKAWDA